MDRPKLETDDRPDNEIVIAVMGPTGTGKSTLINLLSGGSHAVGHNLLSCTSQVAVSCQFELEGRKITLVDTPGFDDSTRSDTEILEMIALHLATTYREGFKLSGIIYMHRISDYRMGGVSRKNFSMFRKLCGDSTLKNVLIVTNMWGTVDEQVAKAREKELATDERLFKPVLDKGARMVRHYNTLQTAHNVIYMMLDNRPMALKIQEELVDYGMDIAETEAGKELDRQLAEMLQKHKAEMEDIKKKMEEALAAKDEQTLQELEEVRKEFQEKMEKIEKDRERLSREYAEKERTIQESMEELKKKHKDAEKKSQDTQKKLDKIEKEYKDSVKLSGEKQRAMQAQIEQLRHEAENQSSGGLLGAIAGAVVTLFFLL